MGVGKIYALAKSSKLNTQRLTFRSPACVLRPSFFSCFVSSRLLREKKESKTQSTRNSSRSSCGNALPYISICNPLFRADVTTKSIIEREKAGRARLREGAAHRQTSRMCATQHSNTNWVARHSHASVCLVCSSSSHRHDSLIIFRLAPSKIVSILLLGKRNSPEQTHHTMYTSILLQTSPVGTSWCPPR